MARLAIGVLSVLLLACACEKRKGTLLPNRESAQQELKARAPTDLPAEGKNEDLGPQASEAEKLELEKVKLDASERIRLPGDADFKSGPRPKAQALFERGRALAAEGEFAKAQEYYLVACQFGYIAGCHKFAWYEQKMGNAPNARQFYRVACAAGVGKSCNNLGVQLEAEKKWEDALNYYAQACLEHHSISCENLKRLRNDRLKAR